MPKITVKNISMYYEMYGQGEPLVFISGFSADHLSWAQVLPEFVKRYQVILFNNRGAGQTDVPHMPYSIDEMAEDTILLCEKLGVTKAHFVGNSMGGYIAQTIAYRYPERVRSITLCNSASSMNHVYGYYSKAQLDLLKANAPLEALVQSNCCWAFSYNYLSKGDNFKNLVTFRLNHPFPFTIKGHEGQYAALSGFNSDSWLDKINVPVLVLGSDQDIIFSEATTRSLAERISQAEYYCFKTCGHLPHVEYPHIFTEVVGKFLQKHEGISHDKP